MSLLASAHPPGQYQRLSDSSFASASYDNHSTMSHRGYGPRSDSLTSSSNFGPTASLAGGSMVAGGVASQNESIPLLDFTPPGAPGAHNWDDDDDMDDALHTFTEAEKKDLTSPFNITSWRGWANGLTLGVLAAGGVMLFGGYPILTFYYGNKTSSGSNTAGYNLGGINASGQYPEIPGMPSMIDPDTPDWAKSRTGFDEGEWTLVFSDEFNKEGRTFFEGDDPFWTAMDIHYWATGDFEWLDPSAVTTKDGHLIITMTQEPIHELNFKSGMIQSWNKMCFNKNAYFEISASLPGDTTYGGFWPGIWTMGNLGRPGYGASTEGMWPYTYDSCDIGILENQTYVNGSGPASTLTTGLEGAPVSVLPGQRTSACTCEGEDHPGPHVGRGRASPEIDIVEAQIIISEKRGEVSQSFQVAPYDDHYQFNNASGMVKQYDADLTYWNTYLGGPYQQAVSSLTRLPRDIYYNQDIGGDSKQFAVFGMEYKAVPESREDGYITWYADNKTSWTMYADAVAANPRTEIGRRIVPEEPMAMIINLHMSNNYQAVDFANLKWPNYIRVDYVRVYQKPDAISIGCDPEDYPTAQYIADHANVYANPNLTTWADAGYTFPKNSLKDGC
ncbi:glucosidase [Cryptococcus wingfieldii CBS 7118]|uniref:Glucosidase n=1 Tax=Cryptococcus wingfieldii CBS 7118 TaxID=1295528 RepID=A0A1E3IAR1_9TREE|nr:glucosidase [Cryptococcus wingfieldii CBS 7118]ODN85657.1 glucosidase [Cryptococcus wingfieldii CBS 7118]